MLIIQNWISQALCRLWVEWNRKSKFLPTFYIDEKWLCWRPLANSEYDHSYTTILQIGALWRPKGLSTKYAATASACTTEIVWRTYVSDDPNSLLTLSMARAFCGNRQPTRQRSCWRTLELRLRDEAWYPGVRTMLHAPPRASTARFDLRWKVRNRVSAMNPKYK